MYFVCQIRNNLLGQMDQCDTIEEAIEFAKGIIKENGVDVTWEVENELRSDYSYLSEDVEWSVCIGIVE